MQRTRTYSLSPEIGDGLLGGGGSASFRSSSSVVEAPAQDFDVPRRVKRRRLSRLPDDTLLPPPLEVIEVDDVAPTASSVPPPPVAAAVPAADEAPAQVIDLSNEEDDDDEAMVVGTRAGTRSRARRPPPLPSRRPLASGASRYAHDLGPGARVSFTARAVEAHGTDPMAQQERAFRRSLAMREMLRSSASGAGGGGAASSSGPGAGRAPPSPFSNADFRDMLFSAMAARRPAALAGRSGSGSGIATGVATRAGGPGGGGGGVGLRASFGGLPLLFLFNSADPDDIFARLDELTRFRMNRGASDEQISKIPTYVVPNSKKRARSEDGDKEEVEEPMCSICLDSLDPGAEVSKLPCSHEFHTACINKWLKENKVCCLCKHDVTKSKPCNTAGASNSAARATFI